MELTNKDTKMLQAFFVMAMLCLHLFDRYDYEGLYQPLLFLRNIPLSFYFAQLCDCCVMGFAFCSGYGHWKQYESGRYSYRKRMNAVFQLYVKYWIIIVAFSVISILMGKSGHMPGDFLQILQNVTAIQPTYNGASWYVAVYAIIILLSTFHLKLKKTLPTLNIFVVSGILYLLAWYVRFEMGTDDIWLLLFGKFGMTMFEYDLGALAAKERVFDGIYDFFRKFPKAFNVAIAICLFIAMLLGHTLIIGNIVVAPVTGFILIVLFKFVYKPEWVMNTLLFLSKYSTGIWLVHMYYYANLFEKLAYKAHYPIFIFLFLLGLSLVTSMILELLYQKMELLMGEGNSK